MLKVVRLPLIKCSSALTVRIEAEIRAKNRILEVYDERYLHSCKRVGTHTMLIERDNGATGYSAVFEDDGKVAYAYLLDDGRIVADVWLYNRAAAPEAPEWRDRSKAPFLNPRGFTSEVPFLPPANES